MEPQLDYSLDVSIPGSDQPSHQGAPNPAPAQMQTQAGFSSPGMNHWALQEACKAELAKGVYPEFTIKAVEDKVATREKGRPMFRDEEWVRITLRGDKNTIINRPVSDEDRMQRFPALYTAFKQGQTRANFGTPLEEWPLMSRSQVETLKHNNVYTVEDLAGLDDQAIQGIGMGAREWMNQAKAYLEQAEDAAAPAKLVKQIEQLTSQVEALQQNNQQLGVAAETGTMVQEQLSQAKVELTEAQTLVNELQTSNAALENRNAELQMKYDAEKQAHSITKGQLTKAQNKLAAEEPAGE